MSEIRDYREPWFVSDTNYRSVFIDNCGGITIASTAQILFDEQEKTAIADRIVACVNALAGRDPEKLDELLSLYKEMLSRVYSECYGTPIEPFWQRCADALAAFEGGPAMTTPTTCTWSDDDAYWKSTCGLEWWLCDGTPAENNMNYCPKCGGDIEIQETTDK